MDQAQIDRYQQQWLESQAIGRCLHIGCGRKPILGAVNLDPDPERREWADVTADALALPFPDATFDVVLSNHVLPIFADVRAALREMARVLGRYGRMAHVIPDLRYAPSRQTSRYPFERQQSGWYGPEDFKQALTGLETVLLVAQLANFTEFNWSFKWEAIKL